MRLLFLTLLALLCLPASAGQLSGLVTGVADGDSLYVLDAEKREHEIRLLGIDAPEHGQPYGDAAKQSLKRLVHQQSVRVEWQKRDQYGRLLGKLTTASGDDAALHQLKSGLAWWNRKYAHDQSSEDAVRYREAEFAARKKRAGLWSDNNPVPPWRWRYAKRQQADKVWP